MTKCFYNQRHEVVRSPVNEVERLKGLGATPNVHSEGIVWTQTLLAKLF